MLGRAHLDVCSSRHNNQTGVIAAETTPTRQGTTVSHCFHRGKVTCLPHLVARSDGEHTAKAGEEPEGDLI